MHFLDMKINIIYKLIKRLSFNNLLKNKLDTDNVYNSNSKEPQWTLKKKLYNLSYLQFCDKNVLTIFVQNITKSTKLKHCNRDRTYLILLLK